MFQLTISRILQRDTTNTDRRAPFEAFAKRCDAGSAPSCYEVGAAFPASSSISFSTSPSSRSSVSIRSTW